MKTNMSLPRYWVIALFLLALPEVVQAQFTFTTNNGSITITGYSGPGGVVIIPAYVDGYAVTSIGDNAFGPISTNILSGGARCLSAIRGGRIIQTVITASAHHNVLAPLYLGWVIWVFNKQARMCVKIITT